MIIAKKALILNFFIGGLLIISSIISSHDKMIRLYIQDMQQNPIRQAEKSVPFLLQVVIDNMNGIQQPENIPGFENFHVTRYGSSQSTNIINGLRTDRMMFNYALRADSTGTFQIGPFSIKDKDGAVVTSESVQICVGDTAIVHSVKKQSYFLETQVDKKSLYVGEELIVKIRFYYITDFESVKIIEPKFEHFTVGEISSDSVAGKQEIKGQEYRYQEWSIKVYPEKIGTLLVPAVQATYRMSNDFGHGLMGLFDMFGMSSEKTVQAPARSVDVLALPESKRYKNVSAVGQFKRAVFSLKKNKGDVGEGIVATCAITGVGNFAMIKAPQLQLPAGLKYYEANSSVQQLTSGESEKIFEYIIQAEQSGEFKIQPQEFVYFDAQEKVYKALKTNTVMLKIDGDVVVPLREQEVQHEPVVQDIAKKNSTYVFKEGQIDYVLESGLMPARANTVIDSVMSWLLLLLGSLVFLAVLYGLYYAYIGISWYETYWGYYLLVQWQLLKIVRSGDVVKLYTLFEQVCAHFHIEIQGLDLVDVFKKAKLSDVKIEEWKRFVQILLAMVFSQQQNDAKNKQYILEQGRYWIKELLRVCHSKS